MREMQIHVAVTAVADPTKPEEKDIELKQWAARFPQAKFGAVTAPELEQAFVEFYNLVLKEVRKSGALAPGH